MIAEKFELFDIFKVKNMEEHGFGPSVMKSIKVCKVCGKVSSDKQTICKDCNSELPDRSVYQEYKNMHSYCSMCDTVVHQTAHYCPQCGMSLE